MAGRMGNFLLLGRDSWHPQSVGNRHLNLSQCGFLFFEPMLGLQGLTIVGTCRYFTILRKPASWLVAVCERSENRGFGGEWLTKWDQISLSGWEWGGYLERFADGGVSIPPRSAYFGDWILEDDVIEIAENTVKMQEIWWYGEEMRGEIWKNAGK